MTTRPRWVIILLAVVALGLSTLSGSVETNDFETIQSLDLSRKGNTPRDTIDDIGTAKGSARGDHGDVLVVGSPKSRNQEAGAVRIKRRINGHNADRIADDLLKHGHKVMREHHTREHNAAKAARTSTFITCIAIMVCCFICTVFTVRKLCSYE